MQRPSKLSRVCPNCMNTAVKAVEAAAVGAATNALPVEPGRPQLGRSHDTMLASRNRGDYSIPIGGFVTHTVTNPPVAGARPRLAAFRRPERIRAPRMLRAR